jgi:ribosomal protein S27AE
MTSRDPIARARQEAEVLAYRAARDARGLFVRADQLAVLRHYVDRFDAGLPGADLGLVGFVGALLRDSGIGPIEARPIAARYADHQAGRFDTSASRCSRCGEGSVNLGGGYHECRRCGQGFLLVAPEDD